MAWSQNGSYQGNLQPVTVRCESKKKLLNHRLTQVVMLRLKEAEENQLSIYLTNNVSF
jgi:hypothetical protein